MADDPQDLDPEDIEAKGEYSLSTTPSNVEERARLIERLWLALVEQHGSPDKTFLQIGVGFFRDIANEALNSPSAQIEREAIEERAAIVKWLRGSYSLHPLQLARKIEAGEHLSSPPSDIGGRANG